MSSSDRIEQRVFLAASPERVWRALTNEVEFADWFGTNLEGRIAAGAQVHMTWKETRFPVDIVELTPHSRYVWRWHPGMHDPAVDYSREPQTTTVFELAPHENGTMLTITESGFDAINAARRAAVFRTNVGGWLGQAASLRKYLENHAA